MMETRDKCFVLVCRLQVLHLRRSLRRCATVRPSNRLSQLSPKATESYIDSRDL